jgi:biopolymer transport protein ExbD
VGGLDSGGERESAVKAKKGKKRRKRRLGIRIDMTPMVDIAFLLLTFFMLTSVFRRPQTMEINLPPQDVEREVKESELLTLRVMSDATVWWCMGVETPRQIEWKNLHDLLMERKRSIPGLITLVRVDRKAKYTNMVDVMDELNLAALDRFSLASMRDVDVEDVTAAGWVPREGPP